MRNQTTAEKNIVDALKSFDSKKTALQLPAPTEKVLETLKESSDFYGVPSFRREGKTITVSDQSTFEYSVLGESISSTCVGLDQLLVAFDLEKLGHHAFETFAWYSSAFQFMDSIMSIRGVHVVHKPETLPLVREIKKKVLGDPRPKELLEIVQKHFEIPFIRGETQGTGWSFAPTSSSHESRWNDFGKLLVSLIDSKRSKEIPDGVRGVYGYLKGVADFRAHRLEKREFSFELRNDGQFKSAITTHGKEIANIRHRAVYQNKTYDAFSYTMLRQGRKADEFTNVSRKFVKTFALATAKWNAEMLGAIWSHLKNMRPYPQRALDWQDLACRYIPLWFTLAEVRLEEIHAKKEIATIHSAIPSLITDILASMKVHEFPKS